MLKDFLETDTVCFRVGHNAGVSDMALRRKQDRAYEPLLEWFRCVTVDRHPKIAMWLTMTAGAVRGMAMNWPSSLVLRTSHIRRRSM